MKKKTGIAIILITLILFSNICYAKTKNPYSSNLLKDVKCSTQSNQVKLSISVNSYTGYKIYRLSSPNRIIIDIPNSSMPSKPQCININSTLVKSVRYAQNENNVSRVVIDTLGQPSYFSQEETGQLVVFVANPISKGVNYYTESDSAMLLLEGLKLSNNEGSNKEFYTEKYELSGGKYTVTFPSTSVKLENKTVNLKDGIIKSIQVMNDKGTQKTSIVFNAKEKFLYKISTNANLNRTEIKISRTTTSERGDEPPRDNTPVLEETKTSTRDSGDAIEKPNYKNITYNNVGDRKYLLLDGAKLTEWKGGLKYLYTGSYDETGLKYTITFPSNLADIGSGVMKINDSVLDSIEIVRNENEPTTSIIFTAKDKFIYRTMTRELTDDTAITILKPATREDRLVVIDAGHGGKEPGAVSGDLLEKNLNLDISIRLNNLLKSKNIKTYMTREDDNYVGLYERAYITNDLNATLFLSIHNNAFNSVETGTETLYFPGAPDEVGFSSKRFAKIIQDSLVGNLGTFNRGIVPRPGLVVLKETDMHSALAEIAFIMNKQDKSKLLSEEFRQRAAEALCDAVIKSLQENQ